MIYPQESLKSEEGRYYYILFNFKQFGSIRRFDFLQTKQTTGGGTCLLFVSGLTVLVLLFSSLCLHVTSVLYTVGKILHRCKQSSRGNRPESSCRRVAVDKQISCRYSCFSSSGKTADKIFYSFLIKALAAKTYFDSFWGALRW